MFSLWPLKRKTKPLPLSEVDVTPDQPISFGYKTAWFAVRTDDFRGVCDALALHDLKETNWATGMKRAYHYPSNGDVFITPPIKGWVCVVGSSLLFELTQDFKTIISKLSQEFGEVCFFQCYRVSDVYAWTRGDGGVLTRYYASVEGESTSEGPETDVEMNWMLPSGDPNSDEDAVCIDEDMVLDVASSWSFDPREIEGMTGLKGTGFVGRNPAWSNA